MSMEPDVLKIASQKDVEQYELQNNVDTKNKGKAIQIESPYNQEFAGSASDCYDDAMYNNGSSPVSNSLLDPDSLIYEDDDDYNDEYGYEMEMEEEEPDSYSMYQDLFDSKDLPTGVEVSMEFFPDSADNEKTAANTNGTSKPSTEDKSDGSSKKPTKGTGIHSPFFSSDLPTPIAQPWKALPHKSGGVVPNSAYGLPQLNNGVKSPFTSGSNNLEPQTPDTVMGEAPIPAPAYVPKFHYGYKGSRPVVEEVLQASDPSRPKRTVEDFLGKYLFFKRFDIAEDSSDHYYASKGTATKQHSKEWVRRIQEEWRTLENDLPEMIFVRAYESRMDLLRAVIIGAQGTPYHDGLFYFDIFFPDSYPSVPPNVHYHSGGLRINPNLYNCGKVCLSLLGTWSGSPREKWIPNDSTMLQVLVSIQGLILNEKPYFNEPGYERSAGSPQGESASKAYSENTFILSLKTMVYNMRRPPKYFEDFSHGHFYGCAHDVLKACDAYRNGAPVGTKVKVKAEVKEEAKDEVKDAAEKPEKPETCSTKFRKEVSTFVETVLLHEFIVLGVKGLESEEEEKPADINNVPESSTSTRSRSKRDRGSSS